MFEKVTGKFWMFLVTFRSLRRKCSRLLRKYFGTPRRMFWNLRKIFGNDREFWKKMFLFITLVLTRISRGKLKKSLVFNEVTNKSLSNCRVERFERIVGERRELCREVLYIYCKSTVYVDRFIFSRYFSQIWNFILLEIHSFQQIHLISN